MGALFPEPPQGKQFRKRPINANNQTIIPSIARPELSTNQAYISLYDKLDTLVSDIWLWAQPRETMKESHYWVYKTGGDKRASMIKELLNQYDDCSLECEGLTRVLHTVLGREGIEHR